MREHNRDQATYIEALKKLTPREIEILELVGEGYTSKEISGKLYIGVRTVQKHRERICRKLGISGYRGLFEWCKSEMSPGT